MADQLTAVTGSGEQTTTQSPQTAGQSANTGAKGSSVQPGTATALLNGQGSVQLSPTALTTVSLANTSASTTPPAPVAAPRHANPLLLGMTVVFFVVAIALFWFANRSAKTTT